MALATTNATAQESAIGTTVGDDEWPITAAGLPRDSSVPAIRQPLMPTGPSDVNQRRSACSANSAVRGPRSGRRRCQGIGHAHGGLCGSRSTGRGRPAQSQPCSRRRRSGTAPGPAGRDAAGDHACPAPHGLARLAKRSRWGQGRNRRDRQRPDRSLPFGRTAHLGGRHMPTGPAPYGEHNHGHAYGGSRSDRHPP